MSSVSIQGNASGTGIFTIASPNSNTNRTLTLPDNTGTVITTASTFAGTGPAFGAYASATQSITTASWTKITLGSETFDTNGNFASSRFTPTVAGYYQLNGAVNVQGSSSITRLIVSLYKNGSEYARGNDIPSSANSSVVSNLIYFNGSTDYVELYAYVTGTGIVINYDASVQYTYLTGALVRSA